MQPFSLRVARRLRSSLILLPLASLWMTPLEARLHSRGRRRRAAARPPPMRASYGQRSLLPRRTGLCLKLRMYVSGCTMPGWPQTPCSSRRIRCQQLSSSCRKISPVKTKCVYPITAPPPPVTVLIEGRRRRDETAGRARRNAKRPGESPPQRGTGPTGGQTATYD